MVFMWMLYLHLLYHLKPPTHLYTICLLNINFGVEHEQPGSLVFLNHKISRKNDDIVTSVYRKFALSDFFIKVKIFS